MFGSSNTKDNKMISKNHKCLFCGFNFKMGFTLIELLATLVVLAIIALIVYPTIGKLLANNKTKAYEKQLDVIEVAASNWLIENEGKLKDNAYALPINDIVGSGFIEENELINPINNEPLTGCIFITWRKNIKQYEYNYVENCEEFIVPKLLSLKASSSENEHGWRNKDFYVSLSGEYLENYYYCIDNKKCEPNIMVTDVNKTIAFNEEGIKYVCAYGTNKSGETESICEKYKLDKTKPVIGSIVFSGKQGLNNWFVSDVTVNVTESTDALSGIDNNILSPSETSITKDTKGTTYTLTAKDKAGNISSVSYAVKIDKTKPILGTLTISGTKGNNDWYKSDVVFSVKDGSDSMSGHASTTSSITSITKDTKGTKVILTTKDNAGNTTTKEYIIKMDKTAPKIEMVNPTNGNWTNKNIEITSNFSDNISGIVPSSLAWSDDNTNWHNYSNTSTTTFKDTWSGEGNRTGYNKVCDYAGNCSTTSTPIRIDKTDPIVGELVVASGTLGTNGWYTSNVVFSVKNGSDALSGHGSTTSSISSITTNTKGTNVVVTTKDKAGNSTAKTYTFKVDKNAPTITPKYSTVTIGSISEVNVSDLFIINYSISGGYVTCNVNKTKDIKAVNNPLRCTVKGGNGLIAEARINVKNQLASIAVTTPPNKTLYSVGSAFDKTGMVVTAYYKDGTSKVVTNYTIESSVTRYGPSHIGKVKKNWGINYLYPTRRDLDEYDDLIITYTEDGVTKTTTTPITVAIYANQVKNIVIASELARVNVSKVTNYYSNPGGTSHIKTSYEIPTDNEYYRYEVGSNYIRLHSLKAGYYSSDLIRVHFELYDGTIFRAGYFENIDSVNTDIKYSFTVARFIKNSPPYGQFLGATGYLFQQPLTTIVLGWQTFNNITDASGSAPIGASAQNGATYMEYKFSNFVMNGRNMNVVYTLDS
jgi:prepilin-type N-terminal cleavage/methylation domain-containing protein